MAENGESSNFWYHRITMGFWVYLLILQETYVPLKHLNVMVAISVSGFFSV